MSAKGSAGIFSWIASILMVSIIAGTLGFILWAWAPVLLYGDRVADPDAPAPQDNETVGRDFGDPKEAARKALKKNPRHMQFGPLVLWWDAIPQKVREASIETGPGSNVHIDDYIGPDACKECHKKQHSDWLGHAHKRMNAVADSDNVEGDFSEGAKIDYLGGVGTFFMEGDDYRMRLERGEITAIYDINQTIGSRFFQYYVGQMLEGPVNSEHPCRSEDHVLPFGYWIDKKMWVPVVHVDTERRDGQRQDPFDFGTLMQDDPAAAEAATSFVPYASYCSQCHTTFAFADSMARKPRAIARHAPISMHWHLSDFLREEHPEIWGKIEHPSDVPSEMLHTFPEKIVNYKASEHAVTLGVSCEACHLGARQHALNPTILPDFHPHSPHLLVQGEELKTGRNHQNLNFACARCHVGGRPEYASGSATWNSTEFTDASLGSCYSQLRCVDCHTPHQGIGKKWAATPEVDDQSCVRCHSKYKEETAIQEHTHHTPGTEGARCMNCHMPRINEGLQDMVRTHTIFSPTKKEMLESNHPNACNMCHTEKPIDWTTKHLKEWYDADFDEKAIAKAYPDRTGPVAGGWMKSENEAVRLVGADAAARRKDETLLPNVIKMLDDPYLLNRQFTGARIEEMFGVDLNDAGYRFYAEPEKRAHAIEELQKIFSARQK